ASLRGAGQPGSVGLSTDWPELSAALADGDRQLLAQALMEAPAATPDATSAAIAALRQRGAAAQVRGLQKRIQAAAAASDRGQLELLLREKAALDVRRRAAGAGQK
ncbi:MAG: hypothetical protein ACRD1E_08625, partial [Terriglobales bacterium]